jgi:hypothetical protein
MKVIPKAISLLMVISDTPVIFANPQTAQTSHSLPKSSIIPIKK